MSSTKTPSTTSPTTTVTETSEVTITHEPENETLILKLSSQQTNDSARYFYHFNKVY